MVLTVLFQKRDEVKNMLENEKRNEIETKIIRYSGKK
jgi:hypothetical protein